MGELALAIGITSAILSTFAFFGAIYAIIAVKTLPPSTEPPPMPEFYGKDTARVMTRESFPVVDDSMMEGNAFFDPDYADDEELLR